MTNTIIAGANGSSCNIEENDMNNQLEQSILGLQCDENDIAKQLECLESRGKKRKPEVDEWLQGLQQIKESVSDINNLNGTHDKRELIQMMKRHKDEKPLTLSTEYVGWELDFNIKKVLKLLEDDKVFVIGIYGMGGVGKTLLATLVKKELMRKATFKDVCWVTVSQNASISKLQHDIAKRTGVTLDEEDERVRADNLSLALETKEKLVLILDDVWEYIDLEKVGIPRKVNGIKVILTTRLKHVCHQMDCLPDHMIQMIPLKTGDGEDWDLFRVKLGHIGSLIKLSPEIEKIAKDIVQRCDGLPLGISVMARTMKGIDDIHQWKHALNKLKKLEIGQEVEEEVFKILKRSYDNLMDKDLQNCFLYCALFCTEDKDELIMKLVDNGQINKNMCLEEIFDEGNTILNKLDAHSLISKHSNILVYPLVRSIACYIMKESQRNVMVNDRSIVMPLSHGWATDLELVHIRCCDIDEISEDLSPNCPKLSTLIINYVSITHVPASSFKYMNSLTILDLSYNHSLESLPNSITNLRSLVSLILKGCDSLKHVPPLGELKTLSRLVISDTSIEEPPQGLEKLINLKWLDLSYNLSLNLELGSFSSYLTKLQYLDLRDTPAVVMVEDIQRMKMLECFGGAIDCEHYYQFMQKNLDVCFGLIKTYHLRLGIECVGRLWDEVANAEFNLKRFLPGDYENRYIEIPSCSHTFSHILSKDHTNMKIIGNDDWGCLCDNLSYGTSSSLKKMKIQDCDQLESLFCLSDCCSFCTNIHKLEVLHLLDLESLTVICEDVFDVRQSSSPGGIFSCLKEIDIKNCDLIDKLFTSQVVQQLQNLETISVRECNSMKEIFEVSNNDDNDSCIIALPKLTILKLWNLPELKIVCKGSIRCRSSPEVGIEYCESLVQSCQTIERVEITDSLFYILKFVQK
ncbi:putative disease resistance protein [Trifolium repens]|nr:putative disease resistance protein [Trifolium repens]